MRISINNLSQTSVKLMAASVLLTFLYSPKINGQEAPNAAGVRLGQTVLIGDVGRAFKDNIGFGLDYRRSLSDQVTLATAWLFSSHSRGQYRVTQIPVSALYNYYKDDVTQLFAGGGLWFAWHSLKYGGGRGRTLGFAANFTTGATFLLMPELEAGADLTWSPLFATTIDLPQRSTQVEGSTLGLYLRIAYRF